MYACRLPYKMASRYRTRGSKDSSSSQRAHEEEPAEEEKNERKGLVDFVKGLWAKTGLDVPSILLMMK